MNEINCNNFSTNLKSLSQLKARSKCIAGFTLPEIMFAAAIFTIMIGAMIGIQIYGLRSSSLAASKLQALTSARQTLNAMRDQIRGAPQIYVGTFSGSTFTQISNGIPQVGNALKILTTTNLTSTNFVVFYQNPDLNQVLSFADNPANSTVVALYQTNYNIFQAEDYQGNILSGYKNNPVIRVTMNFSQLEYPGGSVGGGAADAYDFYYLRTRISRRLKQ